MSEKEQKRLINMRARAIGSRTRVQILEEAERLNVKLLNPIFELSTVGILREEEEQ